MAHLPTRSVNGWLISQSDQSMDGSSAYRTARRITGERTAWALLKCKMWLKIKILPGIPVIRPHGIFRLGQGHSQGLPDPNTPPPTHAVPRGTVIQKYAWKYGGAAENVLLEWMYSTRLIKWTVKEAAMWWGDPWGPLTRLDNGNVYCPLYSQVYGEGVDPYPPRMSLYSLSLVYITYPVQSTHNYLG